MQNQLMMALLPLLVPYITAGIKSAWTYMGASCPVWLKPFRPILGGWIVATISQFAGVPLPSDLAQITDGTVMSIVTSGIFIGGMGSWVRNVADGVKQHFGPDSWQGALARLLAGEDQRA